MYVIRHDALVELETTAARLAAADAATGDELWSAVCSAVDLLYIPEGPVGPDAELGAAAPSPEATSALVDRVARAVRPLAERDRTLRGSDELPAKLEFELVAFRDGTD